MNDFQSAVAQNVKCSNPKPRTFLLHAPRPPGEASFLLVTLPFGRFWAPGSSILAVFASGSFILAILGPWKLHFGRLVLPEGASVSFRRGHPFAFLWPSIGLPDGASPRLPNLGFQGGILMAFQGRSRFATRCMTFISSSWLPFLSLCDGSPDPRPGPRLAQGGVVCRTPTDRARATHSTWHRRATARRAL